MMLKLGLLALFMTSAGVVGVSFVGRSNNVVQRSAGAQFAAFAAAGPDGEAIFKDHCTPCHGDDGKGKAAVGTPDFTSAKIQSSLTDEDIITIITNGKQGTIMPAWKGKLSTEEISAAASYVRSLGRAGRRGEPRSHERNQPQVQPRSLLNPSSWDRIGARAPDLGDNRNHGKRSSI